MFSSLASYVSTSLSPKAWLAKGVANALNEFFVLDDGNGNATGVESNLLTDTKIVLRNARVRPRQLHEKALLTGIVHEIEFTWSWGGNGQSSFVKDTRLSIRGANFQVRIGIQGDMGAATLSSASFLDQNSNGKDTSRKKDRSGYVQRQIQQIIDHLALNLSDFTLDVVDEAPPTETERPHYGICMQAKSLQLISFGRQPSQDGGDDSSSPPLSQRISLESICMVLKSSKNEELPLLERIGYAASVQRVSGRRFMDGWMTGLEVVGEVLDSQGFVIHTGIDQVATLSRMIQQLSSRSNGSVMATKGSAPDDSGAFPETEEDAENLGGKAPDGVPTTLSVPMPSVSIVLPQGETIRMPGCTFCHSVDGSQSSLSGTQGVDIGGEPFLTFAVGSNEKVVQNEWRIDFVQHKISLRPQEDKLEASSVLASIQWKDSILKQVVGGCSQLLSVVPEKLVESAMQEYDAYSKTLAEADSPANETVWCFESLGAVAMTVICNQDWIVARLLSPSLAILTGKDPSLKEMQVGGITIGPTSFGTQKSSLLRFSAMALETKSNGDQVVALKNGIDANLETKAVLHQLQDFARSILHFDALPKREATASAGASYDDAGPSKLPCLHIPKTRLQLQENATKLILGPTTTSVATDRSLCIEMETVQGWVSSTAAGAKDSLEVLSLQGLLATLHDSSTPSTMTVQQIHKLNIPGFFDHLEEPIKNVCLIYDPSFHAVKMESQSPVRLSMSPALTGRHPTAPETAWSSNIESPSLSLSFEVNVGELQLFVPAHKASVSLRPLHFQVKPSHRNGATDTLALLHKTTSLRLELQDDQQAHHWLEASLAANSSVTVSDKLELLGLACAGARLSGSSCGKIIAVIPPLGHSREDGLHHFEFKGELLGTLGSIKVGKEIQRLLHRTIGNDTEEVDSVLDTPRTPFFPFCTKVKLPRIEFCLEEESACCAFKQSTVLVTPKKYVEFAAAAIEGSFSFGQQQKDGLLKLSDLKTTLHLKAPSTTHVTVGKVDALIVPDVFELTSPLLETSLAYSSGLAEFQTTSIGGICPLMDVRRKPISDNSNAQAWDLPCAIHVKFQELGLRASSASSVLSLSSADFLLVPAGGMVSIDMNGETGICVHGDEDKWIAATLGPASLVLDPSSPIPAPSQGTCSFVRLGPCSFGQLSLAVPSIEVSNGNTLQCGEVSATVESQEVTKQIKILLNKCFPSDATTTSVTPAFDFCLNIPKALLSVTAMKAKVIAENLQAQCATGLVTCGRLGCQDENRAAVAFSGLKAKLIPSFQASIAGIDALYLPNICSIERPITQATSLAFEGETFCIRLPAIGIIKFESGGNDASLGNGGNDFEVPFPVLVSLPATTVKSFSQNGEVTSLSRISISLKPQEQDPFASGVQQALFIQTSLASMENKLLKLSRTTASGVVYTKDLSTIHRFRLVTSAAEVTAGLSSVEWASVFGSEQEREQRKPISLPMAAVDPFVVKLNVEGGLIGMEEMTLNIPAFQGGEKTDSESLVQHIKQAVMGRFPAMIVNAKVLGESLTEMSAKTAGRALLAASTVTGAATGSVVGLVASDGIKASITSGKQSRNANEGDGYQFGDFTKGAVHSISQAAKSGAQARRGHSEDYQFGDWTVGASMSAAGYAGENKSRLGAAGGSGMGMMIGCALAGPVGLVAGSVLGSRLGGKVFESSTSSADGQPQQSKGSDVHRVSASQAQGSSDLLGLSTSVAHQPRASHRQNSYPQQVPGRVTANQGINLQTRQFSQAGQATADLLDFGNATTENHQTFSTQPTTSVAASNSHPHAHVPHAYQQQRYSQQSSYQRPNQAQYQVQPPSQQVFHQAQQAHGVHQQPQKQGYRFGDLTRKVVARGKEQSGRSANDGYKFGDFTRGLFK